MEKMMKPAGIIVHHSLTKDGATVDWGAIKKYHMTAPEYLMDDIGYHAGVERINGVLTVIEGRPINMKGGHTKGHNNTLGLCIVGNFDLAPPDEGMLNAAANVCASLLRMFPYLSVKDIHMHREYASYKSCPGNLFPWAAFINKVTEVGGYGGK